MEEAFDNKSLVPSSQTEVATSSVQAAVTAEIQSGLIIAKRFPRDEDNARTRILRTCKRPRFAPCVEYSKPIGSQRVTGLSVRAAEVAGNSYGNLKTMVSILFDDEGYDNVPGRRIINISAMDLETNTSYSTQAVIQKTVERSFIKKGQKVYGERINSRNKKTYIVKPSADEFEVKVASTTSKLLRNNILRLIPEDIKDEMIETARKTIMDKAAEDPDGERKKIIDAFSDLNILPTDLKEYLGKDPAKLSPAEIVDLGAVWKTIKDGQSKWSDYIEEVRRKRNKTDEPKTKGKTAAEKIAAKVEKEAVPPQPPEYKDVDQVIVAFRSAADIKTLEGMKGMLDEVDPGFKEEAKKEFSRLLLELKSQSSPIEDDNGALRRKLQSIAVGLDKTTKTEIAEQLFGDANKKWMVKNLQDSELVQLLAIFDDRGLIQDDE